MPFDQSQRLAAVTTPFGPDILAIRSLHGSEKLGGVPRFELQLVSEESQLDPKAILGQPVGIAVALPSGQKRYFHGHAVRFSRTRNVGRYFEYRATVAPWLWFLGQAKDCRTFQEKSAVDIVQEVCKARGFDRIELRLNATYTPWGYCVQYRESDLNFVSRLLEQEGIASFFTYEESRHTLVLADSPSSHRAFPGYDTVEYKGANAFGDADRDRIREWHPEGNHVTGAFTHTDYDFEKPRSNLTTRSEQAGAYPLGNLEVYDYPGEYTAHGDGDSWARVRMEELAVRGQLVAGSGDCHGLAPGHVFELSQAPVAEENGRYLVREAEYLIECSSFESGSTEGGESFECRFTVQPADVQFRPERTSEKPRTSGLQTAVVVGPKGEEIYTDKHSRIKVQFHWDRVGKRDENSSCWVRVAQPWAGKGWGSVAIPRIGQEVVVDFLEGDPDQPLVIGSVYNADQTPPYELPGKMVVSGLKSNTHKGKGYNEMSMDDTAGKEKITIHAQYDMNSTVGHDYTETIKNDATIEISQGKYKHDVKTGTADYHVQAALTEKYDATQATTIQSDLTVKSTAGVITISADAKNIYIKAATNIKLETGQSTLEMFSNGDIKLTGLNVAIVGSKKVYTNGDEIVSEAGKNHEISGQLVKSTGSTSNTVQGQMVMLNP